MSKNAHLELVAALSLIVDAAEPLREAVESPAFRTMAADSVAVWALNKGFELTAAQVRTLAAAFDLIAFALCPTANETHH